VPQAPLDHAATLRPYMPRLLIGWLAEDPGSMLREVEGTIVFVDISGFTKMSERLARKGGKVGAEEVTDVIGAVFTSLLSVAHGEGGGLIKFGGDALLLLFTGQDHPLKGARAAVGMRKALREIGAIETTAGKVTLRMSVGLHSGTFHFFLVGDSHRELIITGPAATETVSMEGTAVAGEILASRATAELLPSNVLGRPKGDGVLLRSMPKGLPREWPALESSLDGVDLLSCIPLGIRESVLSGAGEPEHRQVTVAFIHFDGIDDLIREDGWGCLGTSCGGLLGPRSIHSEWGMCQ
jgi:class 3 adenylate cyclase